MQSQLCHCYEVLPSFVIHLTFGMKYPSNIVSSLVILGTLRGTTLPILWTSWITASVYGMLDLSFMMGRRNRPTTLSISSWTFSECVKIPEYASNKFNYISEICSLIGLWSISAYDVSLICTFAWTKFNLQLICNLEHFYLGFLGISSCIQRPTIEW